MLHLKKISLLIIAIIVWSIIGSYAQNDPFAPKEEEETTPASTPQKKENRPPPYPSTTETTTITLPVWSPFPIPTITLPKKESWKDDATIRQRLSSRIQPSDIKAHLQVLASDEMEGRETGQTGQRKAAAYIAEHFERIGLQPSPNGSYFQHASFVFNEWIDLYLAVNGEKYRYMWDYYAFPFSNNSVDSIFNPDNEVVFLGYGIDDDKYSDYMGVDVKDKVIIIYQGEPLRRDSVSYITGRRAYSDWTLDWRKKLEAAKRRGVKAVIFIEPDVNARVSRYRDRLLSGQMNMGTEAGEAENFANSIYVSKKVAKAIIGKKYYKKFIRTRNRINKKGKPYHLVMKADLKLSMIKKEKTLKGENVVGFVEGIDPELKKEIVIVSAHYDHLGKKGGAIYNGADDNGSGTSTVLDMAEAIAHAKKEGWGPRRSILFLLLSGEEKGLLGSEYYVNYPIYPLEQTVADINVDMIGRVDKHHANNPNYVYVIGADRLSTELHDINEAMNQKYTQLELDYTYNEPDDPNRFYERSDHYNFAKNGIPSVFYFSGVHPDYHQITDTAEKINYEKTAKIGQLILHTLWQLANQDKRIQVNVKE